MKSSDNIGMPSLISFPASRINATPVTEVDGAIARERDAEIRELCCDTARALQEIRHGIISALLDTLQKTHRDKWALIQLLDESPSAVQSLMDGDFDDLTTEIMIEYLEKLG
jgi:hypothetical protein